MLKAIAAFVLALYAPAKLFADQWEIPKPSLTNSPNAEYSLLISPNGINLKDPPAYFMRISRDRGKGLSTFQFPAVNRVSPVAAFISDHGHVLTLNDWRNSGFSHSIVVYGKDGSVLRDSTLEQVLSADEIARTSRSMSSRRWLYMGEPVEIKGNSARMTTVFGHVLSVNLDNGEIDISRATRFPRLIRLLQAESPQLSRVEYHSLLKNKKIQCAWEREISVCEELDSEWNVMERSRNTAPVSQFTQSLLKVFATAETIESPHYCASGCEGRQEIRLYFWDRPTDGWSWIRPPHDRKLAYQVTIENETKEHTRILLPESLEQLRFHSN